MMINRCKVLMTLVAVFMMSSVAEGEPGSKSRKPNIIFIMADDLGYGDLGCYGQEKIRTPHIDQLALEGIRFTQAYAGGPVCTPSRCALMTGLHNGHAAARDNVPHYHTYLRQEDVTVAEILQEADYRCGGVGKWSLGDQGTEGRATNQGFDMWFGYLNQDHAHYYYTEYLDDSYRGINGYRYELPGNTESRKYYSHSLLTERALQFIRDCHDKPFFLYAAFALPHYSALSEDKDQFAVPFIEPFYAEKEWDEQSKKYASMVHMLDSDVGRMMELLDELGLTENTLVIFTSDNGGHRVLWEGLDTNGPLRGYKRDLTEGGIRVPFIARWPGVAPAGERSDEVIAFQDFLPTMAELAGVSVPENSDGISVLEAIKGNKLNQERILYWDYGHCRDRYDQAVRMGNWKGIRLGAESSIQLYNLDKDIGEENDIAVKYPEIVKEIEEVMKQAYMPNKCYPVGELYSGGPIWKK